MSVARFFSIRRRATEGAQRRQALTLTVLEPRDTPAIPAGLGNVYALQPDGNVPAEYAETHAVIRTESHTMTTDQSGTGSAGTFSIDVIGSAGASDDASGWGEADYGDGGRYTVESGGGAGNSVTYHLVIGGTYANGTFTVTSETYTETGSYTYWQAVTRTLTGPNGGWYAATWDATRSGTHTLSWTAALDSQGVLAYTSYTLDAEDVAHWHTRSGYSYGGYTDYVFDTDSSVLVEWDGAAAVRTGSRSWSSLTEWYYPGSPPYEGSNAEGETTPVSDTVQLPWLWVSTYDWEWQAPVAATGFTFRGESEDSAGLTEAARISWPDGYNQLFEVTDFGVTSHSSDSAHTVYDEAGVDETGTGATDFHRDELFAAADDVTGSGQYEYGAVDATYQAVQTGTFAVDNSYDVTGSQSSGTDEEGEPYDLLFNYSRDTVGGGTYTTTYDYHDAGDGVELTNATYTHAATSTATSRSWGDNTGVAFDSTSVTVDPTAGSISLAGSPGPVAEPDGLVGAVPFRHLVIPNDFFYVQTPTPAPLPTTPVRGLPGSIQNWYNRKVQEIGGAAAQLVTSQVVLRAVMNEINDTPNGQTPRASGTFTHPSGQTFVIGLGREDDLREADRIARQGFDGLRYSDIVLPAQGGTTVNITYAVDGATQNPRSGRIVATYQVVLNYQVTNRAGQRITVTRPTLVGTILLHSPQLERMTIQP